MTLFLSGIVSGKEAGIIYTLVKQQILITYQRLVITAKYDNVSILANFYVKSK